MLGGAEHVVADIIAQMLGVSEDCFPAELRLTALTGEITRELVMDGEIGDDRMNPCDE